MTMPAFKPTARPIPSNAVPTSELKKFVPHLSIAERDRRWSRTRSRMMFAELDALVFLGNDIYFGMGMANLRYMFQLDAQLGGDALFPATSDPVVWTGIIHMNRPFNAFASMQDWVGDVRGRAGLGAIVEEIRARGLEQGRIGIVGFSSTIQRTPTLLHREVEGLKTLLPGATFVEASWLIEELRVVKSEEEIEMLRGAGRIARKAVDALIETARPGVPEAVVYAEMIKAQIANGAEPNIFNLWASGPVDHPEDELWHLLHGSDQPIAPTMRPLETGDIIISELHTKYGGYRCHTEYTVYLGKQAPKELLRIWDVAVECLHASKAALTTGRTIGEAVAMIRKPAERAGLDWVELGFHAMGTASPEHPSVVYPGGFGVNAVNGAHVSEMELQEGMAFGNNINLHDANWKVDVGVMLADFMVVRDKEAELLVNTPLELAQIA
ncbi:MULTISPECIES: M24 family metallopeptidase [Rhizobium]|uniref:Xaa-Pro aminopeptidase n=1 Tax=Rhizobium paranaense TaxID=1650438 RepID=A0A7W9D4C5_9HYPH|nr:M24 family metallopeptidase [Rhizobium paranaense]MBB5577339.1 Xaa-Pro aminopeptidase [Rhizobium paranaense]